MVGTDTTFLRKKGFVDNRLQDVLVWNVQQTRKTSDCYLFSVKETEYEVGRTETSMCCMTNRFWQVVCLTILYYFLCWVDLVLGLIAACVAYRPYSVACFLVYLMTLCQLHKLYGLEWRGVPCNVEGGCHTVLCLLFRHLHTATEVNHGLLNKACW